MTIPAMSTLARRARLNIRRDGTCPVAHMTAPAVTSAMNASEKTVTQAAAARPAGDTVWIRNRPFPSLELVARRRERFPGWAAVWVLSQESDEIDGRAIRFVEEDRAMVERLGRYGQCFH